MPSKAVTYRLDEELVNRLSSWSLMLKIDKTAIIREAFNKWEESRTDEEKRKIKNILKELQ